MTGQRPPLPPFNPKIDKDDFGCIRYQDGRVFGTIEIVEHGKGLYIEEWFCAHKKRGCTTEALEWLRAEGYTRIVADHVIRNAIDYWEHMMTKGLVDEIYDEYGRQLAPHLDDSDPNDPSSAGPTFGASVS